MNMFKHYKKVYIEEELPEACLGCVFMGVDNKLWAGVEKGYPYALKLALAAGGATACLDGLATHDKIFELFKQ